MRTYAFLYWQVGLLWWLSGSSSQVTVLNQLDIVIEYFGGRPHAIRGDVNVKKDGSHKTLTEIDFESAFAPIMIKSFLSSVNRDTLIFHADSIPDTLKAKTQYKSFYSPVKIIEKKTNEIIENPEPEAPAPVEDIEEAPADSIES